MPKYTHDGGVIPSGIPTSQRDPRNHYRMFGVYRGMIVRAIYPEEQENSRGDRIEYVVRVNGQDYPNAIDLTDQGGIYDYHVRVRKGITESQDNQIEKGTPREKMNGEVVFVMFIEGNGDIPLIVGNDQHPRHAAYKTSKKDQGAFDVEEFNGVEFSIDKDSNYSVKQVGRKDDQGKILNEPGKDSFITLFGNGDIELNSEAQLKMKFTKAEKKMEMVAGTNMISASDDGINIKSVADATIEAPGKMTVKGEGGTDVGSAAAPTNVLGQVVNLAGGGVPVARVGSKAIGTGNAGAPVVSTIVDGSPKVSCP